MLRYYDEMNKGEPILSNDCTDEEVDKMKNRQNQSVCENVIQKFENGENVHIGNL